jgi:ribonuclease-3
MITNMEAIGDALLNVVITLELSERFPGASSGALTCKRARIVSRDTCADIARTLGLGGGNNSIKARIGAIFVDSGKSHEIVHAWIVLHWSSHIRLLCNEHEAVGVDAKTELQECTQRAGLGLPTYDVVTAENGLHQVSVSINRIASYKCTGEGTTKKQAEKDAATKMLCVLKETRDAMMSTARRVRGGIVFPGAEGCSDLKHMCRWHAFHTSSQCIRISALHASHASHTTQILSS